LRIIVLPDGDDLLGVVPAHARNLVEDLDQIQ